MAICASCVATWIVVASIGYFVYQKFFSKKKEIELQKADWKKDVVYLYQFPRPKSMANYSPYCMKVEAFLRVNNIKYENIFTPQGRSRYGLLPFIELNGAHYADSQLILGVLKKHFKIESVEARDEGVANAVERMVDTQCAAVFVKYKFLEDTGYMDSLMKILGLNFPVSLLAPIIKILITRKVASRIFTIVGGQFSDSEFHSLLRKDLDGLRDILGDRKFLLGDKIHAVDCAVFGQLAALCYLEHDNEVKRLVSSDYPTLVQYQERFIAKVFPNEFPKH